MVTRAHNENEANTTENAAPMNAAEAIAAAAKAQKASLVDSQREDTVNERGFRRVFDKDRLVGKAFTIVDWDKVPGEYGLMYDVNIVVGTRALWFRDGGSGISDQLERLAEKGTRTMIACPRGLRKSTYNNNYNGELSTTYYLDENDW